MLVDPPLRASPVAPHTARSGRDAGSARAEREASALARVIDSQGLKALGALGGGGYDAGKRNQGRKRHVAVDTDGRLPMVQLTPANVQDAAGAQAIATRTNSQSGSE
ncbi:transposase [Methylobacterium nodulans]|uniref:transposase n=1 Tax=Methylobacterium nodulans TaxID=114616 RepID=UPI0002DB7925